MAYKTFEERALEINPLYQHFIDSRAREEAERQAKNNIPTISFKGKAPDKIEINKQTLIEFIISGQSRILQNNINVELITTDDNITFSKKQWDNVDYGFTLKTNVTAKQEGTYTFQFNVNGEPANALCLIFYDAKIEAEKGNMSDNEPKGVISGYTIEFAQTSKFVVFDTAKHTKFVLNYTNAYQSYQKNFDKESEKLLKQYLYIKINAKTYKTNSVATVFGRDYKNAFVGRFQGVFEIDNLFRKNNCSIFLCVLFFRSYSN
jgi:hypothetical protein